MITGDLTWRENSSGSINTQPADVGDLSTAGFRLVNAIQGRPVSDSALHAHVICRRRAASSD